MNTRRQFLVRAPLGVIGAVAACRGGKQDTTVIPPPSIPGAPPTFGTAPAVGPEVTPSNLAGALMRYAELVRADLSKANLTGADLSGANITGANLDGATLTNARLDRVTGLVQPAVAA